MAVTFRDFAVTLREVGLERGTPVIAHASLSAFGEVRGGADAVIGALMSVVDTLIMPAFTYRTMLIPEEGPEGNGMVYGTGKDANKMAEFFRPDLPVDPLIGAVAEALRRHPKATRSHHPILSFAGIHAEEILQTQTLENPFAPIGALAERGGWVLLLGVNHTVNTSIHYAEKLAGRRQFTRWALTPQGVKACPAYPGCSDGFEAVVPRLGDSLRRTSLALGIVQAVPLKALVETVRVMLTEDPYALLCGRAVCERCDAIRSGDTERRVEIR